MIEVVSLYPLTLHPLGVHRPIVEAVLAGDSQTAFSSMRKHAIEFGEILIKMEKTYRQKK
jgi:DNA-binding FadR family transcriptional regulator